MMDSYRRQQVILEFDFVMASRYRESGAFEAFVRLMWDAVEPSRLQWAPYMGVVCYALQRQMLGDPKYRNLLVMLPPGFAKSLLVSVMAPAFEWLFDPSRRKLFFSAGNSLNIRDSRRCRNLIKSPRYQQLLAAICEQEGRAPWTFANDQNAKANFETSERGFRQVLTIKAGVTGNRGDDIVIDDPIDAKAVVNGTREAVNRRLAEVNNTYDQAISSRLNNDPDRPSRRTVVMQRLDVNDLVGHLARSNLETHPWFILCLPLRYEADHPMVCHLDPRTVEGELLHPDRITEEEAKKKAIQLKGQALAQLQMRPVPKEGGMIKRANLHRWNGVSPESAALLCTELLLVVDPASKAADENDFYAAHLWGRTEDGRMRLIWRRADRMTFPEFVDWMTAIGKQWKPIMSVRPSMFIVEETANGTPWLQSVGRSFMGIPVTGYLPSRDFDGPDKSKAARFVYFQLATESGMVEIPDADAVDWNVEEVVDQWCAFPQVDHDDDCDPASMAACRWMTGAGVPARYTPAEVLGRALRGKTRGAKKSATFADIAN